MPRLAEYTMIASLTERLRAEKVERPDVYRATCPAHRDRGQHLRLLWEHDGPLRLFCLRGCAQPAILRAMGLAPDALGPRKARVRDERITRVPRGVSTRQARASALAPRVGDLERAILWAVGSRLGRGQGLPRDRLPAALWHWPHVSHWQRGRGEVWSYPAVARGEYRARQASLSRALASLRRKGLIGHGVAGCVLTHRGRRETLNGGTALATYLARSRSQALDDPAATSRDVAPPTDASTAGEARALMESPRRHIDLSPDRPRAKVPYRWERRLEIDVEEGSRDA